MRINHNIAALNTHRQLTNNTVGAGKSLEKLSSGFRINRAGDDAAGLAISEKMRSQIRGLDMAVKNSQDSISLIQTAEGAMNEVHSILQRMRELSVQAVNDTNTESDRQELQKEINQLTSEINRVGNTTEFNEKKLLNGDLSANLQTSSGTATVTNIVASGIKAIGQEIKIGIEPITWTAGSSADFDINIAGTADNGFKWSELQSGVNTDLVITRNGDEFEISFSGTDTNGLTLKIDSEKLTFDGTTYSYDSQGISFSFTAAEATAWASGASVTLDLTAEAVAGFVTNASGTFSSVAEKQAVTIVSGADSTKSALSGIEITSGAALDGVTNIKIEYAANVLTVKLNASSGAATAISTYTFSASGGTTINFEANGIKFDLLAGSGGSLSGSYNLETARFERTETISGTEATTTDASLIFQTGSNQNQTMALAVEDIRAAALGIVSSSSGVGGFSVSGKNVTDGTGNTMTEYALNISTSSGAANAISVLDKAIKFVSAERSKLGAVQNRLEHTINNLGTSSENLTAAESRIRDVDMAKEMMTFTKDNILTQAAQAMLAQANQQPQGVLQLLR